MVLEIFTNPSTTDVLMLTVLFLLFVMAIKKIMGIVTNMILISVAAVLFPILGSRLLGLPIPTDTHTLLLFVMGGIGAYFIYLIAQELAKVLKGASRVTRQIIPKRKKHEKVRIIEKERIVREEAPKRFVQKPQKSVEQSYKNYVVIEDNPEPQKKKSLAEPLPDISKRKRKG